MDDEKIKLVNQRNDDIEDDEMLDDEANEDDEEDTSTEAEDYGDSGIYPLKMPFMVDGKKISKIKYDLTAVKPIQYINLVAKLSKKEQISVPELNMNVQIWYFSYASGIPVNILKNMPSTQDFTSICALVRSFLLGVSDTESEEV